MYSLDAVPAGNCFRLPAALFQGFSSQNASRTLKVIHNSAISKGHRNADSGKPAEKGTFVISIR